MRSLKSLRQPPEPAGAVEDSDPERIAGYLRRSRMVMALAAVILASWGTFAKLDGAVIASGHVAIASESSVVQHLDGGIVGEILVRDGDRVRSGDILVRLDTREFEEQLAGLETRAAATTAEYDVVTGELTDLRKLRQEGLVTNQRVFALEREAARLEGESGQQEADRARLETRIERAEIRAPIDGYVHALSLHTIGGVVAPGQEILRIVPSEGALIAEVRINPRDVEQIHIQQAARVGLIGFNRRTTPRLEAVVTYVSADLLKDPVTNAPYYKLRLSFLDGEIDRLGGPGIKPGMPVEAYVRTAERSVLGYLLKPLTDQIRRAMREQ